MTPLETLSSLRESVDRMLTILNLRSTTPTSETDRLRQYNEELLNFDLSLASNATVEPLELRLYSLIEQHPLLKKAYIAASHALLVDICLEHLHELAEIQRTRDLLPTEIELRQVAEEGLKQAQQNLADALDF